MRKTILIAKNAITIAFILIFPLISASATAKEQLIFSIDLVRHGDRNPMHDTPNSKIAWEGGTGELTKIGEEQEQQLGVNLRKIYVDQTHLLPATYNPNFMYVRSTDTQRTIKSAEYLLAGLYPLDARGNQIIKIDVIKRDQDDLKMSSKVRASHLNDSNWQDDTHRFQDKLNAWSYATGMPLNSYQQLSHLADNLRVRRLHHLPLPAGINQVDAKQIIELSEQQIVKKFKSKKVSDPVGKAFFQVVKRYFNSAIERKSPLRYVLFVAHDATLMSVMNTLNIPFNTLPGYASRFNVSLFKDGNRYFIKMSFNGQPIQVPVCGGYVCMVSQLDVQ